MLLEDPFLSYRVKTKILYCKKIQGKNFKNIRFGLKLFVKNVSFEIKAFVKDLH